MASNDPENKTNGAQPETTNVENGSAAANMSAPRRTQSESQKPSTQPATVQTPLRQQSTNNLGLVASPSPRASPRTSRNASPTRKDGKPQSISTQISTQPSAAAIQRALSAANVPSLPAGAPSDGVPKLKTTPKSATFSGDNTPHWPISPRLKSPPPSGANSRRGSTTAQKKNEATAQPPSINVQSATPQTSTPPQSIKPVGEETPKQQQLQTPAKGPSRGPSGKSNLETVQENSTDDKEPSPAAVQAATDLRPLTRLSDDETQPAKREANGAEGDKQTQQGESGSESAGTKSPKKKDLTSQTQRPKNAQNKSYSSLAPAKSRQPEGKQNMTVETETVASIPQSALSAGDRSGSTRNDNTGSVKLKPSSETIRPKKERKKTSQKARSINQSTSSSKADIFEQRVANAVDEANSSDSDETFVYESNPPEPQRRARHHSRTPSVTSSHSVADQQRGGVRAFGETMDDRRVAGKRSMKFSNNSFNDVDSPDSKDGGSVRSHQPRHFGRFGRGGSQASMFDPDSPFTQASKMRNNPINGRNSRPNSPRSPQNQQQRSSGLFGRNKEPSFDYDAEGGDDERTPLVNTVRTPRSMRLPRRINSASHSIDEYYGVRRESRCGGRFGGCVLGFFVFVAVVLSTLAFLVMSNRPMYDIRVQKIDNVLASEQALLLDLLVEAVNPNALGITVEDMDIDIFAKSKHVIPDHDVVVSEDRKKRRRKRRRRNNAQAPAIIDSKSWWDWPWAKGGVDHGTDPDDDLEHDAQTMLLGRVFHFDQALSFDASPLKRNMHSSVGELRLAKPGNKTETGGSERWEKVIQYPFDLIIRGVLKYQLPISNRVEKAAVSGSVTVHPEEGVDKQGHMRVEPVDATEKWQWIDWKEVKREEAEV